ncbi:MAG: hypothetical protein K5Q00_02675 [Gammaproteobacteria bacterium]|nr:hypothetical protein [Gammaproteobacteria bacterium]
MQRKSVKTILFGLFLGIAGSYVNAYAATAAVDSSSPSDNTTTASPSPIQPGFYYSVGYTYATIKNAGITNISLRQSPYSPSPGIDYPYLAYENKYGGGSGANAKISYLWQNHWGTEINFAYVKISATQGFNGTTNIGDTPTSGQYTRKVSTFFTEALGEYAFSLTPSLALLAKAGAGYEYQNQVVGLSGIVGDGVPFVTTAQQKEQHFGPAAAAELRYAVLQNVSLGFELNDLAAHQNIIAANANVVVRF